MKVVWDKSGVPIRLDRYCVDKLLRLFQKWDCIKKIEKKALLKIETGKKIKFFHGKLDQLCDISATDAYKQLVRSRRLHWKEDFAFLENKRGSRTLYTLNFLVTTF